LFAGSGPAVVKPETVVRWHRAGFRRYWASISKGRKHRGRRPASGVVRHHREKCERLTRFPAWETMCIGRCLRMRFWRRTARRCWRQNCKGAASD